MNSLRCGRILGSLAVLFSISSSEYVTDLALFVENKSLNPILVSTFFSYPLFCLLEGKSDAEHEELGRKYRGSAGYN